MRSAIPESVLIAQDAIEELLRQGLDPTPEVYERFYRTVEARRGSRKGSPAPRSDVAPLPSPWARTLAAALSALHRFVDPKGEAARRIGRAFAVLNVPSDPGHQIAEVDTALNVVHLELVARARPTRVEVNGTARLEQDLARERESGRLLESECQDYHDLLCTLLRDLIRLLPPSSASLQRLPAMPAGPSTAPRDRLVLREFARREVAWISREIASRGEDSA